MRRVRDPDGPAVLETDGSLRPRAKSRLVADDDSLRAAISKLVPAATEPQFDARVVEEMNCLVNARFALEVAGRERALGSSVRAEAVQ